MKVLKWMVIGIAITVGAGQPVYAGCSDPAGPGVDWSGCDFRYSSVTTIGGTSINPISLDGANLSGASFDFVDFEYIDFRGALLAGTTIDTGGGKVGFRDVVFSFEQTLGIKNYDGNPTTLTLVTGDIVSFPTNIKGTADILVEDPDTGKELIGNVAPRVAIESIASAISGGTYRKRFGIQSNVTASENTLAKAVDLKNESGLVLFADDPYWQIELGVEGVFYFIEEVIIHNNVAEAKYDKGLENSQLMITDWGDVGSADSPPFGKQPLLQQNFDSISRYQIDSTANKSVIKVGRTGRFVRIQKLGKSAELAFKEIEVIVRAIPRPNSSPKPDGFVLKVCGASISDDSALFDESKLINDPKCSAAAGGDYSYCDLKGKSFANASFPTNADFSFADLSGVDFSGANLEGAILKGANLRGANLSDAYIYNGDAPNADFREVAFSNTNVTDMSNANACFSDDIDTYGDPESGVIGWTIKSNEGVPFYRPSLIDNSAGYERQSSIDNQGIAQYATDTHDADAPTSTETVGTELGAWWSLDIGGVYRVDELAVLLNEDKCTNCENLVLWMSDWPIPEAELKSDTVPDFVTTYSFSDDAVNDGAGNFTFDLKKTARYLVIKLPSNQQGPLSITNVDFNGSSTPVVPDTSPPIPDDKQTELESASGLRADLDNLNKELSLFESDLDELGDTTSEAIEKTNKIKRLDSRLNKLNKALKNAEKLSERLQVIPPFKSKAVKLKSIVSKAQKVVQKVYDVVHPLEVDVAEPVRKKLISVQKKAQQGSDGTDALLDYTKRGLGLVNNALNCSINDSSVDAAAVNLFGATTGAWVAPIELGRVVIGGVDYYQKDVVVDTDSPLDNDVGMDVTVNTIDVIISQVNQQLTLGEIDALDIQLSLLEDEFYPFYGFLEALNSALSINIDVGLFEFSIADILDGIGSIPFLSEFEAIAYGIIQPILDEISKLLPSTDLPNINLPNFPEIDLVAIPQFNFKIPSFEKGDLDFFELTLPTFPQCAALIQPEMKPNFYEDLDGDGLINGAETIACSQRQVGEDSCLDTDPITGYNPDTNNYPFTATLAGNADSDLDGMSDYFEVIHGLTPNSQDDATIDSDGDGLTNLDEYLYGTNPNATDTDSDQLPDQWEVTYSTLPADVDKGITATFDPTKNDGAADFDLDGISNSAEYANGLNPFMKDSDADNLPDGYELASNCSALGIQLSALDATDAAADFDNDRLLNITEYQNGTDICSADTDGDGLPDGGEVKYGMDPLDGTEDMSIDSDGDGLNVLQEYAKGSDISNADTDGDGRSDKNDVFPNDDTEWQDFDQDGYGNNQDPDDDNDGVNDAIDAFPFNGAETVDTDRDGIGNNADPDDDNDGVNDNEDLFPLDSSDWADADSDGIGNNTDPDDDNDGVNDVVDAFPFNGAESVDTDGDGIGNNSDLDDDNDGVSDSEDVFPLDSGDWADADNDGIGNNADPDDDNDSFNDNEDAFPFDSEEWLDTDGDSIGNNADPDDDNDGVNDSEDLFPLDSGDWADADNDGIGNNADPDDDNDGVNDSEDAFPFDSQEWIDTDGDGIGNNADPDDDNDGVADESDSEPLNPKAGDTESPTIGEIEDKVIEATAKLTTISLETPVVTDNSSFPITVESTSLEDLTLGSHVITWTAIDYAGNQSTAEQVVKIVDTTAPAIVGPYSQRINAAGEYTNIRSALDIVVEDIVDENIELQIEQGEVFLSGRHQLVLFAIDESGNRAEIELELDILPRVMLQERAVVFPRAKYSLPVALNGKAPQYPVNVTLELLINGESVQSVNSSLEAGEQSTVTINIPENAAPSDKVLLSVVDSANAYFEALEQTDLIVSQSNTPPRVEVSVYQAGNPVSFVQPDKGTIELKAVAYDDQPADSHQVNWISNQDALPNLDVSDIYTFESASLATGILTFDVNVSELNTTEGHNVIQTISIDVIAPAKLSDTEDTDGDGIIDSEEGYTDTDADGIADYLDNDPVTSRLKVTDSDYMKVTIGQNLMLGTLIQSKEQADRPVLTADEIIEIGLINAVEGRDSNFERVSDIFNFRISGLTSVDLAASIVIPLDVSNPIPAQAIYRKFSPSKGWYDFIESDGSAVYSSVRDDSGNCPDVRSPAYVSGLLEGATCVKLTIIDGGSNDIDNLVNGIIEDPGAIVVARENNAPAVSIENHVNQLEENQQITLNAVAEDTEQDSITYLWQQISGPQVQFTSAIDSTSVTILLPDVMSDDEVIISVTASDGALSSSAETTISIGNKIIEEPIESKSSGGALHLYLMLLIGLYCFARRSKCVGK